MLEDGEPVQARKALEEAGLEPFQLATKEGLALINGTDGMLAMLLLALEDCAVLLKTADVTAAMSVEALFGTDRVFGRISTSCAPTLASSRAPATSPECSPGPIVASHAHSPHLWSRTPILYAAPPRCTAQRVTPWTMPGGSLPASSTPSRTTPVVLPDGRVESAGNFHGEPLAFALDFLAIAASEIGASPSAG